MKAYAQLTSASLALMLLASSVMAAVSPQQADQLGTSLTPLGAQKEGNANGSIPAWTGGGARTAGHGGANGFLADPFASEKPLFIITAQNAEQYKDKLSAGQLALFKRFPQSYRIPVYPTHRSATIPPDIMKLAKDSALHVTSTDDGNNLANFADSGYTAVRFEEEQVYPRQVTDLPAGDAQNLLYYYKQRVTSPARLAGTVALVHETIDQVKESRRAWVYNAGQRRVRRAPQLAYDGPGTASDGLRTADNLDM